jgi:hypothetical protein
LRTQQEHKAQAKVRGTMLRLDRHITASKVPSFKQQKISFRKPPLEQQLPALGLEVPEEEVLEEKEDDGAEELLMDSLIGESCGDGDILEESMTVQEVFDSVQRLLSYQKQPYAPRTFLDLSLLKQYTA